MHLSIYFANKYSPGMAMPLVDWYLDEGHFYDHFSFLRVASLNYFHLTL